jgi:hypothetical protein
VTRGHGNPKIRAWYLTLISKPFFTDPLLSFPLGLMGFLNSHMINRRTDTMLGIYSALIFELYNKDLLHSEPVGWQFFKLLWRHLVNFPPTNSWYTFSITHAHTHTPLCQKSDLTHPPSIVTGVHTYQPLMTTSNASWPILLWFLKAMSTIKNYQKKTLTDVLQKK